VCARCRPYVRQVVVLQRELPGYFLIEGTYVGSYSEHIPVNTELDPVPGQYFSTSPVRSTSDRGEPIFRPCWKTWRLGSRPLFRKPTSG